MEELNKDNIDFENKKCICCNQLFNLNSDLKRHIKTAKHIKKLTGVITKYCPFCNYITDDKSNLNKHIKSVHQEQSHKIEENIIKVGNTDIPETILNQYFLISSSVKTTYFIMSGKKHRIKQLKNRNFKDDEAEVIEAKKNYKEAIELYNFNVRALKSIQEKYPEIIKAVQPKINNDGEAEEDSDNDDKDEVEKVIKNNILLYLEDLKDELDELYEQLRNRDFEDLIKHKKSIKEHETIIKKLMNDIYKK